jgi:hypothetical protein
MNAFSKNREFNATAHQLGFAKGILQALIIASENEPDVREQCMLQIAEQAANALRKELAA